MLPVFSLIRAVSSGALVSIPDPILFTADHTPACPGLRRAGISRMRTPSLFKLQMAQINADAAIDHRIILPELPRW